MAWFRCCWIAMLLPVAAWAFVSVPTVVVGDPANPAHTTGRGSVAYSYHIGTHEVTMGQYTAFLNSVAATDTHGLWNSFMAGASLFGGGINRSGTSGSYTYATVPGADHLPVRDVTFWDAARFANWLTNGQPTGPQNLSTTESGMYLLNGVTNPVNSSVVRQRDFALGQSGVAIASLDEWYKAAYYDPSPTGPVGDYWLYPTRSNTAPTVGPPPGGANSANFDDPDPADLLDVDGLTIVGGYTGSGSYYGTFDQAGNVFELNDTIHLGSLRGLRGGSLASDTSFAQSSNAANQSVVPTLADFDIGFRLSSLAPIPEPAAVAGGLGLGSLLVVLGRRARRVARR